MERIEYLKYDENIDHLTFYKANEKIVSSIDAGYAILSLNSKKEIVGLEFMGVNKNFGLPLDVLKNIAGCKVRINYRPKEKMIVISVILTAKQENYPIIYTSNLRLGNSAYDEVLVTVAA